MAPCCFHDTTSSQYLDVLLGKILFSQKNCFTKNYEGLVFLKFKRCFFIVFLLVSGLGQKSYNKCEGD